MAKPEEEKQAGQPQPTRNLREFYQAQPPMGEAIRNTVQRAFPSTMEAANLVTGATKQAYQNGGLISGAAAASRRALLPAAGVAMDVGRAAGRVSGMLNPWANAQSAPTPSAPATAKQPTVQKPAAPQSGSMLGLTPVSLDKMWNTPLNQPKPAAPAGNVRSRPTVPGAPKPAPQVAKPAAPTVAQAAAPAPAPQQPAVDDSVIIDRGIGRPGSTMAMIDHETGSILTAGGGTDTYRPFEGQYMTQDQQDLITGNRLKVGDPMTVGQSGAISKQAALITDRALAEAAANSRTDKTVAGATEQQRIASAASVQGQQISSGASIEGQRIAHGEDNKRKAQELKARAALVAAIESGDGVAISKAQQQLAAFSAGTGTEFAPLNMYDDMGNVIGQRLYNKKNGVVQGDQGGAPQQFESGKVYTDANGNRAKYVDGKWQGVK